MTLAGNMSKSPKNTRQVIVDAACHLFAEHGYQAVTLKQIAQKAEVPTSRIHYHFKTKEAVYFEVFRHIFNIDQALTYKKLLEIEPFVLDSPEGRAYAIQRIIYDYYSRHIFFPEPWKRKLILKELYDSSPFYVRWASEVLSFESDKMSELFYILKPEGTRAEAFFWANYQHAHAHYYLLCWPTLQYLFDDAFLDEIKVQVINATARNMILMLKLPVPEMLQ